jgi:hypothetical protein
MWWIIGIILYILFVISILKFLGIAKSSDIDSDSINEINNEHFSKYEDRYE